MVILSINTLSLLILSANTNYCKSYVGRARIFGSNLNAANNQTEYTNHVSSNSPTENELMLLLFIVAVMLLMFVYIFIVNYYLVYK